MPRLFAHRAHDPGVALSCRWQCVHTWYGTGTWGGSVVVGIGYVVEEGQLGDAGGLDELRLRWRAGYGVEGDDSTSLGAQHRLDLVREDRPGGGRPQVIDAVEAEQAVLMDMATDD